MDETVFVGEESLQDELNVIKKQCDDLRDTLGEEAYRETMENIDFLRTSYGTAEEEVVEGIPSPQPSPSSTKTAPLPSFTTTEGIKEVKEREVYVEKHYCSEWPQTDAKAEKAEERLIMTALKNQRPDLFAEAEAGGGGGGGVVKPYTQFMVQVGEEKSLFGCSKPIYMNTFAITPRPNHSPVNADSTPGSTLVFAHGYGAGAAFYFRNFSFFLDLVEGKLSPYLAELSVPRTFVPKRKVDRIFVIDWLGFGRSSRPSFPHDSSSAERAVDLAEAFFVEALERWREKMGLERFILIGHSLGGYMATAYSMPYGKRVEKLILLSPAGLGEKPEAIADVEKTFLFKVIKTAINMNLTPYSLIRGVGPKGPALMRKYVHDRYDIPENEAAALASYFYQINAQSGSGEFALRSILLPGAMAVYGRKPLVKRVHLLTMPTTFVYGSHDWMNPNDGKECQKRMKVVTNHLTIFNAGHNLFVDNPRDFHLMMVQELFF